MTCNSYFACYLALLTLILAIIRGSILAGTDVALVFVTSDIVCSTKPMLPDVAENLQQSKDFILQFICLLLLIDRLRLFATQRKADAR